MALCRARLVSSCPLLSLPEELQNKIAQAILLLSRQRSGDSSKHELNGERALLSLRCSSKQAATFGQLEASTAALETMVFKQQLRWLEEDVHNTEQLFRDGSPGYDSRVYDYDDLAAEADVRNLWERFDAVEENAWSLDCCHPYMCGCGLSADQCSNSMFPSLQAVKDSLAVVEEAKCFMRSDHERLCPTYTDCGYTTEEYMEIYGPFAPSYESEEEPEEEPEQESEEE